MEKTAISWTDNTFNIVWGCSKVSDGCKNCYAEQWAGFTRKMPWGPNAPRESMSESYWRNPVKWNEAAKANGLIQLVFTSSMADVMEDRPENEVARQRLWPIIESTPWLIWQILTKRPENYAKFLPSRWRDGCPWNVWLGTTIESAKYVNRARILVEDTPEASAKFVSYEPALSELWIPPTFMGPGKITWVIYGGESGNHRRPDNLEWAKSMRAQCQKNRVAFFYKQESAAKSGVGHDNLGSDSHEMPNLPFCDPVFSEQYGIAGRYGLIARLGSRFC